MAVDTARIPVARELKAVTAIRKTRNRGRATVSDAAVKTIITGVIALGIIALAIVSFIVTRDVLPGVQLLLGIVITYYFTQGSSEAKRATKDKGE